MRLRDDVRIHPTASVADDAEIGSGTSIWNWVQIRERARIGHGCIISKSVYIDAGVEIGNNVKIQNNVSVYHGVSISDGVFVGPHVCFTNDLQPRAIGVGGEIKGMEDWVVTPTFVAFGASLGANSTIRCGISIGAWAMVGAGSVVVKDVLPFGLVVGNPARLVGFVCKCGSKLPFRPETTGRCEKCSTQFPNAYAPFSR